MKDMLKKKKILAIIGGVILVLTIGITCIVLNINKKEDAPIHKEETYSMFVKINPLVKLTFKEEYYLCKNDDGKKEVCGEQSYKVSEYELINDDAKTFYKDLEFTNKDLYEVLLMLCETAKDNNIDFKKLEITTDSNNITNENVLNYLQDNSKYEISFSVYVDFEENINEENILKNEEIENKIYLVTFDSNGGSKVENQTVDKGNKVSRPTNPTKEGYKFVDWQLDGKTFNFETEITTDITLQAKWEKQKGTNSTNQNSTKKPSNQNTQQEEKPEENVTVGTTMKGDELPGYGEVYVYEDKIGFYYDDDRNGHGGGRPQYYSDFWSKSEIGCKKAIDKAACKTYYINYWNTQYDVYKTEFYDSHASSREDCLVKAEANRKELLYWTDLYEKDKAAGFPNPLMPEEQYLKTIKNYEDQIETFNFYAGKEEKFMAMYQNVLDHILELISFYGNLSY